MKSILARNKCVLFGFGVALTLSALGALRPWERLEGALYLGWSVFVGGLGFLMLRTGKISRWRAALFIPLAWGFILHFKAFLLGLGGSAFFSPRIQEVPYCHIAIASSFLNTVYQQYLAIMSGHWSWWGPLTLGALFLVVTLALGQGWCSWGCFYGGLDEGFSRILKRPLATIDRWAWKVRDLPAGILLAMLLLSLGSMLPIFCLWLCPLKATTAFLDRAGPERALQLILFVSLGLLTIVLLPLILKRRVFCGLICPFGAWQAFFGRIHPARVTIDPARCTGCGQCVKVCPTFVLTEESLQTREINAYCNRCGECMDACPGGAIDFTLLGKSCRTLYLFAGLVVGGAVGGLILPGALARLIRGLFQ